MSELSFTGKKILVVGGAGFVGSNLVLQLQEHAAREIIVVDNLLSAEADNVPEGNDTICRGSITDDSSLASLPDDLDFAFHLSCYHGNQSSIADPVADHENNTFTSLKLFERLKEIRTLQKVVYAAAGCAVAEKVYGEAEATREDAPVSLFHDSPYSCRNLSGSFTATIIGAGTVCRL